MKALRSFAALAVLAAAAFALAAGPGAYAAPQSKPAALRLLASNAVRTTVEELRAKCEQAVGRPLSIEYNPSSAIQKSVEAGDRFDVVMASSDLLDKLIAEGKVKGCRADIARSAVGVGIRAGSPKPDLSSPEGMRRALLAAKAISYTKAGASEPLILKMTDRLGISSDIHGKTLAEPSTVAAGQRVLDGSADILLTMSSEILPIKGLELAGPIPAAFDRYLTFSAGLGAKAADPKAAAAVIKFFTAPSIAPVLKAKGMEPPKK